jgi:hypothetical protein
MIPWTTDEAIHRIVKREIPSSERGTIVTLNDMPDWMVEEARAIARESIVGAVRYLKFYVARPHASGAEDFVEDVLLKGQDARTWRLQDCICIPWPPISESTIDIQRYLNSLKDIEGERWFRIRPKLTDRLSDYIPGMVGVVQRNSRYWHVAPPGSDRCPVARPDDIEVVPPSQLEAASGAGSRTAWHGGQDSISSSIDPPLPRLPGTGSSAPFQTWTCRA